MQQEEAANPNVDYLLISKCKAMIKVGTSLPLYFLLLPELFILVLKIENFVFFFKACLLT